MSQPKWGFRINDGLLQVSRLGSLIGLLLLYAVPAEGLGAEQKSDKPAVVFQELLPWLARGSQPDEAGIQKLKDLGYRTVVSFRHEKKKIAREKEMVERNGLRFISIPWRIQWQPKEHVLRRYFEVLDDAEHHPLYMHCKYGRDRSGVMSMMALMRYQGLEKDAARHEIFDPVRASWRYRFFVNRRIKGFLKQREKLKHEESES
ncbi:MAG: hypothetical protein A2Z83_06740 [Omnitrophica bacterium GWA2_52_8]|nr:MAG: hypothetical protein A2Z83_06740 [Omnitrophica bacterium GWA2_52_8]